MVTNFWTEEKVARLKQLWPTDATSADIAESIGGTRSQVIGKAHRLGLCDKVLLRCRRGPKRKAKADNFCFAAPPKLKPLKLVATKPVIFEEPAKRADGRHVTLVELESHQCRWPDDLSINATEPTTFCGARCQPSRPYCVEHAKIASAKPLRKAV